MIDTVQQMQVRQEGESVILIVNGRAVAQMPPESALEVSRAIRIQAGKAREIGEAERVINDQALLTRAGAPFGLTNNPKILDAAGREAAWDRNLRRRFPGGIKSQSHVGSPTIVNHDGRGNVGRGQGGGKS